MRENSKIYFVTLAIAVVLAAFFVYKYAKESLNEISGLATEQQSQSVMPQQKFDSKELLKYLLISYYKVNSNERIEFRIDEENQNFVSGEFCFDAKCRYFIAKSENYLWRIIFTDYWYDRLVPCQLFKDQKMPTDFEKYTDCGINDFVGISKDWKLESGNPRQDCAKVSFIGSKLIHGWYEWGSLYVDEGWVLKIPQKDYDAIFTTNSFPGNHIFGLAGAPKSLENQLIKASAAKPVPFTVTSFSYYCEGAPIFGI